MADLNLRCVRVFGFPDTKKLLDDTYKLLKEKGFCPVWFSEDECFSVKEKTKNTIYIFDVFEGEAFEHISSLKCVVLGPLSVLTSLTFNKEIPRRSTPVYNLAMMNVLVCCTNMEGESKNQIYLKVERMGGKISKVFTEDVTHLVASKVGSKKYQVAATSGIQIMMPEWVDRVWEKSKLNAVHGLDEEFQVYKCPVFLGHTITVSGLPSKERKEAQRLINKEGGKYTGEMKVNECSHLIVNEPKGQKYLFAMKWQIFVVRSDWLYDSIEKGFCQNELDYTVTPEKGSEHGSMKTSTPERRSNAGISDINLSVIPMDTVNETNMTNVTNMTNMTNTTTMTNLSVNTSHMSEPDPTEGLNMQKLPLEQFLDGSKIYLSGFRGAVLEKLRKIINSGGGTRFNKISENLTHIVIGDKIPRDIDQIKALNSRPFVVSSQWLVQCYRQETQVEETPYIITEFCPKDALTPEVKKESRKSVSNRDKSKLAPPIQPKVEVQPGGREEEEDELLSQYMAEPPQNQDATRSNDSTVAPNEAQEEECTQDPDNTTAEQSVNGVFGGKTFVFYGFQDVHIPELSLFVTENGGQVLKSNARRIPDYAVVPLDGFPVEKTVHDIVTDIWLGMCIEVKTLLPIKSRRLFTPIEIQMDMSPLEEVVMSISGYSGKERDCLMHIAEVLGAKVQDYFVHKTSKGLLQSTHLITYAPKGSKYQAAKKWNIPALSKHWILDCARTGRREPEERYDIDTIQIDPENDISPMDLAEDADKTATTNQDTTSNSVQNQTAQGLNNQDQAPSDDPDQTCDPAEFPDQSTESDKDQSVSALENKSATSETDQNDSKFCDNQQTSKSNRTGTTGESMTGDFSQTGDTEALLAQMDTQGEVGVAAGTEERGVAEARGVAEERDVTEETGMGGASGLAEERGVAEARNETVEEDQIENVREHKFSDNHDSSEESVRVPNKSLHATKTYSKEKPGDKAWNWKAVVLGGQSEPTNTPPVRKFLRKLDQRPEQTSSPAVTAMCARDRLMAKTPVRCVMEPPSKQEVAMETNQSQKENVGAVVTPVQSRIKEIKKHEGVADGKNTPSRFLDPNVRINPMVNKEALTFETPEGMRAATRRDSLPLDELYGKTLKQTCKSVSMTSDEVHNECSVLQGVVIAVAKKLSKDQVDLNEIVVSLGGDYKWTCDASCTHFIFQGRQNDTAKDFKFARSQGLLIVSPHWLYMCKEQNARVDETLFPHTFNPNMQLALATKGTPMRTPRSTRRNARERINSQQTDTAAAPSQTPVSRTKNTGVKEEETNEGSRRSNSTSPRPGCKSPAGAALDQDKAVEPPAEGETTGSLEMREVLSRQLENVMAEAKGKKRRRSKRLNNSGQVGTPEEVTNSGSRRRTQENQKSSLSSKTSGDDKPGEKNSLEMAPSQSVHVVWDDPMGRMEQEKLAHKLQRVESPTQDPGGMYEEPEDAQYSETEEDGEGEPPVPVFTDQPPMVEKTPKSSRSDKTPTPEGPSIAFPTAKSAKKVTPPKPIVIDNEESQEEQKPPPVFMLSGITQPERVEYGALVEQLGGTILETQEFDLRCTHLVISRISRNEKLLSCIARGNWILHKSYFEACREQNCFVDEQLYEWGSEGTLNLVKNLDSNVRMLAAVAREWRVKINQNKQNSGGRAGAFSTWKVLLCCDTSDLTGRERNYKRILEAGGATVFKDKPPFNMATEATHAIVEPQKANLTQADIEVLLAAGCHCLSPDFIASYLKDPNVSAELSCPPEIVAVKQMLQSSSSKTMKRKASGVDLSLKRSKKR